MQQVINLHGFHSFSPTNFQDYCTSFSGTSTCSRGYFRTSVSTLVDIYTTISAISEVQKCRQKQHGYTEIFIKYVCVEACKETLLLQFPKVYCWGSARGWGWREYRRIRVKSVGMGTIVAGILQGWN